MSDSLTHECGIAAIRLRKPLAYYYDRYQTCLWGFNKLLLLMEKQHNRGHDGVGIGCAKLHMPLGQPYIFRRRDAEKDSLAALFREEMKSFHKLARKEILDPKNPASVKTHFDFGGEILIGHLRYGTSGNFDNGACHPYLRRSNWLTRTLMVMGNFNMTNTAELNRKLINRGQHPVFGTDTQTVLEEIGFHLDEAHSDLYRTLRDSLSDGHQLQEQISAQLNVESIIKISAHSWDGGYAILGIIGNGDMFVIRDPHGIRPCHMLINEEVIAFASERVPLMTVFETTAEAIHVLPPAALIIIKADGTIQQTTFTQPQAYQPCSFERIYFSRGNDPAIYRERKAMGAALVPAIAHSIGHTFDSTVFSFIPNTAETAYYGMMDGLRLYRRQQVRSELLLSLADGSLTPEKIDTLILKNWPCGEKIAHKDVKMRTFISQEKSREQLVSHVYDITYGIVKENDTLCIIDDSIVRGTTLKKSILKILARTNPKKILVCSTAPQIRYPDCYGINMSDIGEFIAFQAAVNLQRRAHRQDLIDHIYHHAIAELAKAPDQMTNAVKALYTDISQEEISAEISRMVYPENIAWHGEVEIIYQTIENLHASIKGPCGDWYFTGNYPTPGGYATVNTAFISWYRGNSGRGYETLL